MHDLHVCHDLLVYIFSLVYFCVALTWFCVELLSWSPHVNFQFGIFVLHSCWLSVVIHYRMSFALVQCQWCACCSLCNLSVPFFRSFCLFKAVCCRRFVLPIGMRGVICDDPVELNDQFNLYSETDLMTREWREHPLWVVDVSCFIFLWCLVQSADVFPNSVSRINMAVRMTKLKTIPK